MYNWLNVNLYDNNFKQMKLLNTAKSNLSASDSTLNGQLTKYWKIENDTIYLFNYRISSDMYLKAVPVGAGAVFITML